MPTFFVFFPPENDDDLFFFLINYIYNGLRQRYGYGFSFKRICILDINSLFHITCNGDLNVAATKGYVDSDVDGRRDNVYEETSRDL